MLQIQFFVVAISMFIKCILLFRIFSLFSVQKFIIAHTYFLYRTTHNKQRKWLYSLIGLFWSFKITLIKVVFFRFGIWWLIQIVKMWFPVNGTATARWSRNQETNSCGWNFWFFIKGKTEKAHLSTFRTKLYLWHILSLLCWFEWHHKLNNVFGKI